jgi:lipopolysaccharide export system permease protein
MIFDSTLRKELARSFSAVTIVLVTIVMTVILIRTLGQASKGAVNPQEVILVMGHTLMTYLSMVLTLSLFIAVVSTFSRLYADSEMVIWLSSNRSLLHFLGPVFRFAWPVLLIILALSTIARPWSTAQIEDLRYRYEERSDLQRIAPGRFQESANGDKVFFIEKHKADKLVEGNNVYVFIRQPGRDITTTATTGQIHQEADGQYLTLRNGHQVLVDAENKTHKVSSFESYTVLINEKTSANAGASLRSEPSQALFLKWSHDPAKAELYWRFSQFFSACVFVVLGIAISVVNTRSAKNVNFLLALLIFIVYSNLINYFQNLIALSKIHAFSASFITHVLALLMALLWFFMKNQQLSWRDFLMPTRFIPKKSP